MSFNDYALLRVTIEAGVADVVINNPPVNVLDVGLMEELRAFLLNVRESDDVRVIVFSSALPEFFIAHVDMALIDEPHAFDAIAAATPSGLNVFQGFAELIRNQPQLTIVKLAGIARGGGAEFVAAADLSFAAIGSAGLAQCEALMGITPGGGATQLLLDRVGRSRALEIILGADLFDAETAERYGWINRALPAKALDRFVTRLARNVANLPPGVVAAAKAAMPAADLSSGYVLEHNAWAGLFARPAAEALIVGGLAKGAQTVEGETNLEELLRGLWQEISSAASEA
jgi:enoyl-CoA hydratase/carnithine racemase